MISETRITPGETGALVKIADQDWHRSPDRFDITIKQMKQMIDCIKKSNVDFRENHEKLLESLILIDLEQQHDKSSEFYKSDELKLDLLRNIERHAFSAEQKNLALFFVIDHIETLLSDKHTDKGIDIRVIMNMMLPYIRKLIKIGAGPDFLDYTWRSLDAARNLVGTSPTDLILLAKALEESGLAPFDDRKTYTDRRPQIGPRFACMLVNFCKEGELLEYFKNFITRYPYLASNPLLSLEAVKVNNTEAFNFIKMHCDTLGVRLYFSEDQIDIALCCATQNNNAELKRLFIDSGAHAEDFIGKSALRPLSRSLPYYSNPYINALILEGPNVGVSDLLDSFIEKAKVSMPDWLSSDHELIFNIHYHDLTKLDKLLDLGGFSVFRDSSTLAPSYLDFYLTTLANKLRIGEASTVSHQEHLDIIEKFIKAAKKEKPSYHCTPNDDSQYLILQYFLETKDLEKIHKITSLLNFPDALSYMLLPSPQASIYLKLDEHYPIALHLLKIQDRYFTPGLIEKLMFAAIDAGNVRLALSALNHTPSLSLKSLTCHIPLNELGIAIAEKFSKSDLTYYSTHYSFHRDDFKAYSIGHLITQPDFSNRDSYSFKIFSLLMDGISKNGLINLFSLKPDFTSDFGILNLFSLKPDFTSDFEILRKLSIAGLRVTKYLERKNCSSLKEYNSNLQHLRDLRRVSRKLQEYGLNTKEIFQALEMDRVTFKAIKETAKRKIKEEGRSGNYQENKTEALYKIILLRFNATIGVGKTSPASHSGTAVGRVGVESGAGAGAGAGRVDDAASYFLTSPTSTRDIAFNINELTTLISAKSIASPEEKDRLWKSLITAPPELPLELTIEGGFYFYNLLNAIDCTNCDKINELINKSLSKDDGLLLKSTKKDLEIYLKKHLEHFGKISPTLNEEDTNKHLELIEKLHGIINHKIYSTPSILTHFVKTGNFDAVERIFAVVSVGYGRETLLSLTREACKAPYNDNSKKILLALFDNSKTVEHSEERQELREKIMFWALRNRDRELAKKAFDSLAPTLDVSLQSFAVSRSNDIEIAIIRAIRFSWLGSNKVQLLQSLKDIILEPLPRGTDDLSDTSFIKNFDILRKMAIVGFKNPLNFWVPSNSEEERAFKINKDHLDDLFKVGELLRKKKQPLTNEQILTSPLITQKAIFEDIRNHTKKEIGLFKIKSRHDVIAERIYFQVYPRLKFAATSAPTSPSLHGDGKPHIEVPAFPPTYVKPAAKSSSETRAGDAIPATGAKRAWEAPAGAGAGAGAEDHTKVFTTPQWEAPAGAGAGARSKVLIPPQTTRNSQNIRSAGNTFPIVIENPYQPNFVATSAIGAERVRDPGAQARADGLFNIGVGYAWAVPGGTSPAHGARTGAGIGEGEEVRNPAFSPAPPVPPTPDADAARKPGGAAVLKPHSDKALPIVIGNPLPAARKLAKASGRDTPAP